jgi:GAF domain-containing protein
MLKGDMAFICVIHDITERKQAEARLRFKKHVLEGVNRILMETITADTEEELGETCLRVAEEFTQSKFGFIGEINEAGRLDDIAISNPGWDACQMANPIGHRVMPTGLKIHGIYGRVLKDGKTLYTNTPATHPDSIGTPAGHPPITAFLGVPLLHFGKVVGMIGVANKDGGYNDNVLIFLWLI